MSWLSITTYDEEAVLKTEEEEEHMSKDKEAQYWI